MIAGCTSDTVLPVSRGVPAAAPSTSSSSGVSSPAKPASCASSCVGAPLSPALLAHALHYKHLA